MDQVIEKARQEKFGRISQKFGYRTDVVERAITKICTATGLPEERVTEYLLSNECVPPHEENPAEGDYIHGERI